MSKILVIEDQFTLLDSILEMLNLKGYYVQGALTGKIALEVLKTFDPDIILSDIKLPDYNGIDLMNVIKSDKKHADVHFVMMTAQNPEQVFRLSMNSGAEDFLIKPFKSEELFEALEIQVNKIQQKKNKLDTIIELTQEFPSPILRVDFNLNIIYKNNDAASIFKNILFPFQWKKELNEINLKKNKKTFYWRHQDMYFRVFVLANFENKYYNIYLNNITELQHAYDSVDKKNALLYKQLTSLRNFNYMFSHDLRNPVLNCMQLLSLFPKNLLEDKTSKELFVMLEETSSNLIHALDDLATLLQAKEDFYIHTSQWNNLMEICEQVVSEMDLSDDLKQIIEFSFDTNTTIYFPDVSIKVIIREILKNSIEHIVPKSIVAPVIKFSLEENDQIIKLRIEDNGEGFDKEYYSTRSSGLYNKMNTQKGKKGLSLKIVSSIMESHDGTFEISSKLNEGTTVELIFSKELYEYEKNLLTLQHTHTY
jgi:CheY-like chemotaxis protein